jgi:hypothetical protein
MTRPKEMLDRRLIRRGLCDRELAEYRPRRLDPRKPTGLTPGTGFALPLPEPEPPGTVLQVTANEMAAVLDALGHPSYDVRQRQQRYVLHFREDR